MTQQTCDIIQLCKNPRCWGDDIPDDIAIYMGYECWVDPRYYDENVICKILMDAFIDFIESADHPGDHVKTLFWNFSKDQNLMWDMIYTLTICDVFHANRCVNGFTKEQLEKTKEKMKEIDEYVKSQAV